MKTTKMKSCLLTGSIIFAILLCLDTSVLYAQYVSPDDDRESSNSAADNLLNAINNTTVAVPSVSISSPLNVRSTDKMDSDDIFDFVPEAIERDFTITSSGTKITIRYSGTASQTAEDDGVEFGFTVGTGGHLRFDKEAELSGGYSGAGLFYVSDGKLTFSNTANLHDNYSTGSGGAAYIETNGNTAATLTFSGDAVLTNNIADAAGGALALVNGSSLSIAKNTTLTGNRALGDGGGAISADYGTLSFGGTLTVTGNQAAGNGGALSVFEAATTITGTATFKSNYAGYSEDNGVGSFGNGSGGAISVSGGTLEFKDFAIFGETASDGNKAADNGGALFIDNDASVTFLELVSFTGNQTQNGDGGAVYLNTGTLTFGGESTTFLSNSALAGNGGAMSLMDGTVNFNEITDFRSNTVSAGNGGALSIAGGVVNFNGITEFTGNTATNGDYGGGAIYANSDAKIIFGSGTDVVFESNKTINGGSNAPSGGAVYLSGVGDPSGDQSEADYYHWQSLGVVDFTNNESAAPGGAIYAESSTLKFADLIFTGNKSLYENVDEYDNGGGGAIFSDGSAFLFTNLVEFQNNTAAKGSGGAAFIYGSGTVAPDDPIPGFRFQNGAIVSGNSAVNGGAFYIEDSVIRFDKTTTISSNTATNGGAFYIGGSESILQFGTDSTTSITGNTASSLGGAIMVGENAGLTLKLEDNAKVTIAAGSGAAKNDVYLGDGSTLNLNTGAKSSMTFASNIVTDATSLASIVKTGEGTVYIDGDASQFYGNLAIEEGDFYIGKAGTFGDIGSTEIEINAGGSLVLDVGDNVAGNASGNSRVYANSLTLNGPPGADDPPLIAAKALNDSPGGNKYDFITVAGDVKDDLENYIADKNIGSYYDFLTFGSDVNYDNARDETTLSVGLTYNSASHDWTFNLPRLQDEFTLNAALNDSSKKLTVTGNGTLTLTNTNTAGALAGNGNLILNNTLTTSGSSNNPLIGSGTDYSGTISGAGKFVKDGDYTQTLTGKNTYNGGTEVKNGTLIGNTDSLQGNITITSPGTLEFNQNTLVSANKEGTYTGVLSGTGTLSVNDQKASGTASEGLLRFSGDSSAFAGNTNITSGWFTLTGGSLSGSSGNSAIITVSKDGGFGGKGNAGHVFVQNEGVIQAFQGNLNLGSLEFAQGGILYVLVDGANANVIDVAGKATIDGARVKIVGVSNYTQNDVYTFLEADEFEGSFANTSDKFSEGGRNWNFDFKKANDSKSYYATGKYSDDPGPDPPPVPTPAGLSWNRGQVSHAADNYLAVHPDGQTGLTGFIKDLNKHKIEEAGKPAEYDDIYRDATNQLAGSARLNGLQLGFYSPYRTVFNRLSLGSELYGGSPVIYNNGYGPISGINYRGAGIGDGNLYLGQENQVNPHLMDEGISCDIPCGPTHMGENNFWVDVTHIQTKTRSDGNSDSYGISRTGLLIGMDVQRRPDSRLGFLFGYFAPYLWQNDDRVEADDFHFGTYFQKNYSGTDIYGYLGYAHQEFESRRYVDMSQVNNIYSRERYTGKTSGDNFNMSIEISKPRYYGNNLILRPLIGFDYIYAAQYGYWDDPSGSNLFRLRYDRSDYDQAFVRLGLNLKRETFRSTTNFRIQYINQFGGNLYPDSRAQLASAYRTANTDMNLRGVDLGRDYLNLGFGMNLFMNEARSRFVSFDYDLNMSRRTTAHGLSLILVERF